jgi:hypothetical protein
MKRTIIPLLALLLSCIFVLAANAQTKKPGIYKVCLYKQTTKEIKAGCTEIIGRYDIKARYKCFDKKAGRKIDFDPGKDWKAVPSSPVCIKNSITGVVKPDCIKCGDNKDDNVRYLYFDKESGEHHEFDDYWEPLSLDDPNCKAVKFPSDGVDPIRDFDFEINSDPEKSAKEE